MTHATIIIHKGGKGSGHFGHAGRRGITGGSLPGDALSISDKHINEALTVVRKLTLSGGDIGNIELSAEAKVFLKKTVTQDSYELYRGVGLVKGRYDISKARSFSEGDKAPEDLHKVGNNFVSYTTKLPVAKRYSQGKVSVVLRATADAMHVLVDTRNLAKLLKGLKQDIFSDDDFAYFKSEAEIIVEEPVDSYILSVKKEFAAIHKGGAGSGFYDHAGRPGEVGGSLPSGLSGKLLTYGMKVGHEVYILSKKGVPTYGVIDKVIHDGRYKLRWRVKSGDRTSKLGSDKNMSTEDIKYSKSVYIVEDEKALEESDEMLVEFDDVKDIPPSGVWGRGYFIMPDDSMLGVVDTEYNASGSHIESILMSGRYEEFGLSESDIDEEKIINGDTEYLNGMWDKIYKTGVIRVRQIDKEVNIGTPFIDKSTLRRLQRLADKNRFDFTPGVVNFWEQYQGAKGGSTIKFTYEELLDANYVRIDEQSLKEYDGNHVTIRLKGGAGSGHFGHAGRKGITGGSLPGKGVGNVDLDPLSVTPIPALEMGRTFESSFEDRQAMANYDERHTNRTLMSEFSKIVGKQWMAHDPLDGQNYKFASEEVRIELMEKTAKRLSEETGIDPVLVHDFLHQWSVSSNDENMRSLSMQEAASEEFGIELSDWQRKSIEDYRRGKLIYDEAIAFIDSEKEKRGLLPEEHFSKEAWKEVRDSWHESHYSEGKLVKDTVPLTEIMILSGRYSDYRSTPIMPRTDERKLLRTMYDDTQLQFKKMGYNSESEVTLFRGVQTVAEYELGATPSYKGNMLESWTVSPRTAYVFNFHVVAAKVKVKNMFSYPGTGLGCLPEGEIVIFGNIPGSYVKVINND